VSTPTSRPGAPRATAELVLTVVGCRAGMPADGWPSSGYILELGGERLLLDCGPGTATALDRHVLPAELSAVLLSHLHLDHCFDLVVLGKQLVHRGGERRLPSSYRRAPRRCCAT
jgi:ribonuclease BN (tRNA processing enzyme)